MLKLRKNQRRPPTPPAPQSSGQLSRRTPGALTLALAGTLGGRPPPRPVVEERKALFTVHAVSVMLAITHQLVKVVFHTFACMSVTFTPGERRDAQKQKQLESAGLDSEKGCSQRIIATYECSEFTKQNCKLKNCKIK